MSYILSICSGGSLRIGSERCEGRRPLGAQRSAFKGIPSGMDGRHERRGRRDNARLHRLARGITKQTPAALLIDSSFGGALGTCKSDNQTTTVGGGHTTNSVQPNAIRNQHLCEAKRGGAGHWPFFPAFAAFDFFFASSLNSIFFTCSG